MPYQSTTEKVNTVNERVAWDKARELDRSLPQEPQTEADLRSALVSLARRVEELELTWS